jgi:hypothetical protein
MVFFSLLIINVRGVGAVLGNTFTPLLLFKIIISSRRQFWFFFFTVFFYFYHFSPLSAPTLAATIRQSMFFSTLWARALASHQVD